MPSIRAVGQAIDLVHPVALGKGLGAHRLSPSIVVLDEIAQLRKRLIRTDTFDESGRRVLPRPIDETLQVRARDRASRKHRERVRFRAPVREIGVAVERPAASREKILECAPSLLLGDLARLGGGHRRDTNTGSEDALPAAWIGRRKGADLAEDPLLARGKETWRAPRKQQSRLGRLVVATPEQSADESHQRRAVCGTLFMIERAVPLWMRSFSAAEKSIPSMELTAFSIDPSRCG